MHDRRISGSPVVFGNQGGLFMNAMTWWDHDTGSVWSQVWGRAIAGPLKGVQLELLSSELVTWQTWRETHPDTLALRTDAFGEWGGAYFPARFDSDYVIGVTLGSEATAFPYPEAERAGLINEQVGPHPVLVYVDAGQQRVHVYLRQVQDQTLTFGLQEDGEVRDTQTGSIWRLETGLAVDGPLQGQVLRTLPYTSAFDFAWFDFYPNSRWYQGN